MVIFSKLPGRTKKGADARSVLEMFQQKNRNGWTRWASLGNIDTNPFGLMGINVRSSLMHTILYLIQYMSFTVTYGTVIQNYLSRI